MEAAAAGELEATHAGLLALARDTVDAALEDAARGVSTDLAAAHAAFESLRDATDEPEALFALAADEARLVDMAASTSAASVSGEALLGALMRVLVGSSEGTDPADMAWAAERLEALLESPRGRALSALAQARGLGAVAQGYRAAGDLASALRAAERQVHAAQDAGGGGLDATWGAELDAAQLTALELSLAARDVANALRWARARVDTLQARGEDTEPGELADALAHLAGLSMDAGDAVAALAAAEARVALERVASEHAPDARGERLNDALGTFVALAQAAGEVERWKAATAEWVALATERARALAAEDEADAGAAEYAAAWLAPALSARTAACAETGDHEGALAAARAWLAVQKAAGEDAARDPGVDELTAQLALAAIHAQMGDWPGCEQSAAEALDALGPAWLERPDVALPALALRARAELVRGDAAGALEHAGAYLDAVESLGEAHAHSSELGSVIAVLAQAALRGARTRAGAPKRRVLRAARERAEGALSLVNAPRATERDPAAGASALAAVALVEALDDDALAARRRADAALARLEDAPEAPPDVVAFVAYAHERAGRPSHAGHQVALGSTRREEDCERTAARALAAAEAGELERALALLEALDAAPLAEHPGALAHTLAAASAVLGARTAPNDPALARGRAAWAECAGHATLAAASALSSGITPRGESQPSATRTQ